MEKTSKYPIGTLVWNNIAGLGMIKDIIYKTYTKMYNVYYFNTEKDNSENLIYISTIEDMVRQWEQVIEDDAS